MSAPEDRERRTSKFNEKNRHEEQRRTSSERTTRLKPYDRGARHNTHVKIEKGAAAIVQDFDGFHDEIPFYEDDE